MSDWILLADDLRDVAALGAPYRMAAVNDYVARPAAFAGAPKLAVLSRGYGYQSGGYYAALLAEARGHRVIPSVETILDLAARDGYARALPELEEALARDLARAEAPPPKRLLVSFGRPDDARCTGFARLLFDWFRAPILEVTFAEAEGRVAVAKIALKPVHKLKPAETAAFAEAMAATTKRAWRSPKARQAPRHAIAVLCDPKEALPPSSADTLKHWAGVAEKLGVEVEPITRRDLTRLAEFDALFIRETTSIRNHTYRFARRAAAEGMPVIDDPASMIRCTNKVFLWERLTLNGLPTPSTVLLRNDADLQEAADRLGFPLVLKVPDGSFSRGVKKAGDMAELRALSAGFFKESDVLLAQRFLPTAYDWRVGVLGGEPLFICQYGMAKGHWQIIEHKADGSAAEGRVKAFALADAPPEVVDVGVRAARLIGDGLYGVDVKLTEEGATVIEINDNPNLDRGLEDKANAAEVWTRLTRWFTDRLERR